MKTSRLFNETKSNKKIKTLKEENKMKRMLYVIMMAVIIISMIKVGDANSGTLRVSIKGSSVRYSTAPVAKPVAPTTSVQPVTAVAVKKPVLQPADTKTEQTPDIVQRNNTSMVAEVVEIDKHESHIDTHLMVVEDLIFQSRVKTCGEEEDYNLPASERFDDVGNGLFVDRHSCLMWPSLPLNGGMQSGYSGAQYTCSNFSRGGYSDWRVPNGLELYNLVDTNNSHPAFIDNFSPADGWSCDSSFPGVGGSQWGTEHCNVWSSSSAGNGSKLIVDFVTGYVGQLDEGAFYAYTWCVRSVAAPGMWKGLYFDGNL